MKLKQIFILLTAIIITGTLIYIIAPEKSSDQASRENALHKMKESGKLSASSNKNGVEKIFSESTIDFAELHRKFPQNRALPSLSPEEGERKKEARRKRNLFYGKIASNKATDEEVHKYYHEQTEIARDVLVLVNFVLDNYGNRLTAKETKKYQFLKEQFDNRIEMIPRKEKIALERIHKYRSGKQIN